MNFYKKLRDLDHQIVGDGLCAIPTGRAYKGSYGPYADKIHILPFGESPETLKVSQIPERHERPNIYMGTAGLINILHLCRIRPTHGILFDVNPFQTLYWNVVLSLVRANDTCVSFKSALNFGESIAKRVIDKRLADTQFSSAGSWTETLHERGDNLSLSRRAFPANAMSAGTYLDMADFGENEYRFLKNMVDRGQLGTLTLDVFDADSWEHLSSFLKYENAQNDQIPAYIDTLYVSSIFRFTGIDTDWTGRKLKGLSASNLMTVLHKDKSIILDHQDVYSAVEFEYKMIARRQEWPYRPANLKASALACGAGKLDQLSI